MNEEVYANIIAYNVYCDSPFSEPGNNGLVKLVPDAPVNLENDPTVTDDIKIKFGWQDGPSDGGDPVLDYDVYYDQGTDSWVLLESNVLTQYYTTTVTLINDVIYSFKVTARNTVGSGL